MAGHKRERYKTEPRISVPFMLELEYESKIIKKLLVIKEICSWLPSGLDGRKVFSRRVWRNYDYIRAYTPESRPAIEPAPS